LRMMEISAAKVRHHRGVGRVECRPLVAFLVGTTSFWGVTYANRAHQPLLMGVMLNLILGADYENEHDILLAQLIFKIKNECYDPSSCQRLRSLRYNRCVFSVWSCRRTTTTRTTTTKTAKTRTTTTTSTTTTMVRPINFFTIARGIWDGIRDERSFREHFGMDHPIVSKVWQRMVQQRVVPNGASPKHLLWTFYWWKTYNTQGVCARFCQCDKGTFHTWRTKMENAVALLNNVSWAIGFGWVPPLTRNVDVYCR
jgi:hypothetical protein